MKLIIPLFIFLVVFLSVLLFQSDLPRNTVQESSSEMDGIQLKHIQNGITEWSASISNATFGPNNDDAFLNDVHFYFNSQGIQIDADRGLYDLVQDDLTLEGNVKASSNEMVMYIDSISWSSTRHDLVSESPVLIEGRTFSVRGKGLHIDENGEIRIKEDTRARITF